MSDPLAAMQRLLGIMVPHDLGGEAAALSDVVDVCYRLGRGCASTAMIYAMHQTKVACIVDHGHGARWHDALLRRLNKEQLLFASSTTEGQGGGNVRSSAAAIINESEGISLTRDATVISYGAQADGIVTEAAASLAEAVRLNPRHADALNNLGIAFKALGRRNEAVEEVDRLSRQLDALLEQTCGLCLAALQFANRRGD